LRKLSERNPKGIPPQSKGLVFSLIFLCSYYGRIIYDVDYKYLDPETADPLMISFLLKLRFSRETPERLFSFCRSRKIYKRGLQDLKREAEFDKLLKRYKLKNNPHQRSLMNEIVTNLRRHEWTHWMFKLYWTLLQFQRKSNLGLSSPSRLIRTSKKEIAHGKASWHTSVNQSSTFNVAFEQLASKNFNIDEIIQPSNTMELTGGIDGMGTSSTSASLLEELKSLFKGFYSSFADKDFDKLSSRTDFDQVQEHFKKFPYETIEAVGNAGNLEFTCFILRLLDCCYYPYYTSTIIPESLEARKIDQRDVFTLFDNLIRKCFSREIKWPADYLARFINLIVSILETMEFPDEHTIVNVSFLKNSSISFTDYCFAWRIFARNLRNESVARFKGLSYLLRNLSERNPKGIPGQYKSFVFSLFFLGSYYARVIFQFDYKSLEPKTANPLVISLLLRFQFIYTEPDALFSFCRSNEIDNESLKFLKTETKIADILKVYKFESRPNQKSLVKKIFLDIKGRDRNLWLFKLYLTLMRFNY
jgi:hypothetical protein